MTHIETRLAKAGSHSDPQTGAVVAPIRLSTTFERAPDGSYPQEYFYSRAGNPTRNLFEKTLADLEGGSAAAAFSSGMAATSAILHSLKPGDHVIIPKDTYHGVRQLVTTHFSEWGIEFTEVDQTNLQAVEGAFRKNTRLLWVESPSNPMLTISDLAALADIAHAENAFMVVDGTWTTPLLQRPLEFGADLVMHSCTKYIGGHSDVMAGVVVAVRENEIFDRIRSVQRVGGAVADPFSSWLALRGLRTLAARMQVLCRNAAQIATFLESHPRVSRVHYPGLATHPGYALAGKQMADFGGMLSFQVAGDRRDAMEVAARVGVFTRATSLGGTESLIEHRESIESRPTETPENLLRVSVGLEFVGDLISDLEHALTP